MQSKIDMLTEQLQNHTDEKRPAMEQPSLNLDDPQTINMFLEELKNRATKTNYCIQELESMNQKNMLLEKELEDSKQLSESLKVEKDRMNRELIQLKHSAATASDDHSNLLKSLEMVKNERNNCLTFCSKILAGEYPSKEEEQDLNEMILKYIPDNQFKTPTEPKSFLPPIDESLPPSKIPSRIFRRKIRKPADADSIISKQKDDIKSLEDELFAAHQKLEQLEQLLKSKSVENEGSNPASSANNIIIDIKVCNEAGTQTAESALVIEPNNPDEGSRYATSLAESQGNSEADDLKGPQEEFPVNYR